MEKGKKEFIKKFKEDSLNKSLKNGETLELYKNSYKIIKSDPKGYTILEDAKQGRFAIPSSKLDLLISSGLTKAFHPPGYAGLNRFRDPNAQEGQEGQKRQAEPVGAVKQGSDGQWYKKVQETPSKWVHVTMGHSKGSPDDKEPEHHFDNEETRKTYQKMSDTLTQNLPKPLAVKLQSKLEKYTEKMHTFNNLKMATNLPDVKDGKKYAVTEAKATYQRIHSIRDEANSIFKEIIDEIKQYKNKP